MSPFKQSLIWLSISLLISLGIQILVPGIIGIVCTIGVFILFLYGMTKPEFRRKFRMGEYYGPTSNQGKGKTQCIICWRIYDGGRCPRCGSNLTRKVFKDD